MAIVGASGAGKSTLLQILGTLDVPNQGELRIDGTPVHGMSRGALSRFRNENLGFVFQSHRLLPEFNAVENVICLLYTSPSPRDRTRSRMPSSA